MIHGLSVAVTLILEGYILKLQNEYYPRLDYMTVYHLFKTSRM
jgi:hypothetical protein